MSDSTDNATDSRKASFLGLTPALVLLGTYLLLSVLTGSFSEAPISVAFVVASAYGIIILKGVRIDERISIFSHGIFKGNILLMVWIFVLAAMLLISILSPVHKNSLNLQ